jgi:hypothetical protein
LRKEFALLKGSEGETFTDRNQRASKPRHARSVRHPKASECPRCLGLALSTMSCHRATLWAQPRSDSFAVGDEVTSLKLKKS